MQIAAEWIVKREDGPFVSFQKFPNCNGPISHSSGKGSTILVECDTRHRVVDIRNMRLFADTVSVDLPEIHSSIQRPNGEQLLIATRTERQASHSHTVSSNGLHNWSFGEIPQQEPAICA